MEHTLYHSVLRTSALTMALILMFVSGIISPVTEQVAIDAERYVASAVGAYASVEPNGINEITAALTAKENALAAREAALQERELSLGLQTDTASNDYTTYILSVILFFLLVLIVINYVLDFLRSRSRLMPVYGRVV